MLDRKTRMILKKIQEKSHFLFERIPARRFYLDSGLNFAISRNGLFTWTIRVPDEKHINEFHIIRKYGNWVKVFKKNIDFNTKELTERAQFVFLLGKPKNKIKHEDIINCSNVEIRRILIEEYGISRFIHETDADIIHEDGESQLIRIPLDSFTEPLVFVKVKDSSTDRIYFLQVPPDMKTCKQAIAWTFGLSEEEYAPLLEA
ncbi:MAG: hypothetical protein GF364_13495 [Candidatus Lokiarchaeota archaeon]|nr:hypothetical protein [Candidatus Lokiarchaeota archaeon]